MATAAESREAKDLKEALDEGRDAGLSQNEMAKAQGVLAEIDKEGAARYRLESAIKSQKIPDLQGALAEGRASLQASELKEAEKVLASDLR